MILYVKLIVTYSTRLAHYLCIFMRFKNTSNNIIYYIVRRSFRGRKKHIGIYEYLNSAAIQHNIMYNMHLYLHEQYYTSCNSRDNTHRTICTINNRHNVYRYNSMIYSYIDVFSYTRLFFFSILTFFFLVGFSVVL